MALTLTATEQEDMLWFFSEACAPKRRTMRQFAEEEIILPPPGPFAGYRFSCERQPYAKIFFEVVESGQFNRFFATGPIQSGKSMLAFVIPILYYLFEHNETVFMGVKDKKMGTAKWEKDIKPVFERTRYSHLMPTKGAGSRGGEIESIEFTNGATLKIMFPGVGDKNISAHTSRIVVATEIDGWDKITDARKVSDPITELENRTKAFGNKKRFFGECTLTDKHGRTYQEISGGTDSKIIIKCPYCHLWVTPEREHLVGFENAENVIQAAVLSHFICPKCSHQWTETDRRMANRNPRILHKGQEVDADGIIHGPIPETLTLGFRWSSVNNMLLSTDEIAQNVWMNTRKEDQVGAERDTCQNIFAIPYEPEIEDATPLDKKAIMERTRPLARGVVPIETTAVTVGVDVGKYTCWYIVVAWGEKAKGHVIDYAAVEVPTVREGPEIAIISALNEIRGCCEDGWRTVDNDIWIPKTVWIDAHYETKAVYKFCKDAGKLYQPIMGWGSSKDIAREKGGRYSAPSKPSDSVRRIGNHYDLTFQKDSRILLANIDVDYWKDHVQQMFSIPTTTAGAVTLYNGADDKHKKLAIHLTSEKKQQEYIAGIGWQETWVRQDKNNHLFDATVYATTAAHSCGVMAVETKEAPKQIKLDEWFKKKRG